MSGAPGRARLLSMEPIIDRRGGLSNRRLGGDSPPSHQGAKAGRLCEKRAGGARAGEDFVAEGAE